MSDIVERLKYQSGWSERSQYMGRTGELLWDAIDEIERLLTENESLKLTLIELNANKNLRLG